MTILIRYSLKILTSRPDGYEVNSSVNLTWPLIMTVILTLGLTVLLALRSPEVNKNWRA